MQLGRQLDRDRRPFRSCWYLSVLPSANVAPFCLFIPTINWGAFLSSKTATSACVTPETGLSCASFAKNATLIFGPTEPVGVDCPVVWLGERTSPSAAITERMRVVGMLAAVCPACHLLYT